MSVYKEYPNCKDKGYKILENGQIQYANKHGQLILETIERYRPIKGILAENIEEKHKFSIEEAEQLALITGNRRIQVFTSFPKMGKFCVVHHKGPSFVATCRIVKLNYTNKTPARTELEIPTPIPMIFQN